MARAQVANIKCASAPFYRCFLINKKKVFDIEREREKKMEDVTTEHISSFHHFITAFGVFFCYPSEARVHEIQIKFRYGNNGNAFELWALNWISRLFFHIFFCFSKIFVRVFVSLIEMTECVFLMECVDAFQYSKCNGISCFMEQKNRHYYLIIFEDLNFSIENFNNRSNSCRSTRPL